MLDVAPASVALLASAAVHLGFQLTVTFVVYPALAEVPDWDRAHAAHTRAITPVVVLVYGMLVLAGGWALLTTWLDAWTVLAVAGGGVALLATALVAGPAHGRLADGREPVLLRRLLVADRVRTVGAAVCLLGAGLAITG